MKKVWLALVVLIALEGCIKWFRPDPAAVDGTSSQASGLVNWNHPYPKKANYSPSINALTNRDVLAKWDVIILPPDDLQRWHPEWFAQIRGLNPRIKILLYASSIEIPKIVAANAPWSWLKTGIDPVWYLKLPGNGPASFWPSNYLLNGSSQCPTKAGQTWVSYLADFLTQEYLKTGFWDGVFLDTLWNGLSQINGGNFDANNDGLKDNPNQLDQWWREGMQQLVTRLREANPNLAIIGNGNALYGGQNGLMLESFPVGGNWLGQVSLLQNAGLVSQPISFINCSGAQSDSRKMRFGLASALMLDNVYYSYDAGPTSHGEVWWYPEYEVTLGNPTGPYQVVGAGLYRRDFDRGLALVNTSANPQTIALEKQYQTVSGQLVKTVSLAGDDGVILLKP